ncbi:hypothetical protein VNO78_10770 [Psophocarpus tetragonolobus]|uniref:Uncharacterized protein n=1 Tax=Psophocarpus tetragonolobus TaxID=3891 RepID=A0AAN9SMP5_PSOTE
MTHAKNQDLYEGFLCLNRSVEQDESSRSLLGLWASYASDCNVERLSLSRSHLCLDCNSSEDDGLGSDTYAASALMMASSFCLLSLAVASSFCPLSLVSSVRICFMVGCSSPFEQ